MCVSVMHLWPPLSAPNATLSMHLDPAGQCTHPDTINLACSEDCSRLRFKYNATVPLTHWLLRWNVEPLDFSDGCPVTQQCLFAPDQVVANAQLGFWSHFPVFENTFSDRSPAR